MAKSGYLGKTETRVIRFLSENKNLNITRIKNGIGLDNHSAVAKAIHNLEAKGYVKKMGSYMAKGRKVSLWGLTGEGIAIAVKMGSNLSKTLQTYKAVYPDLHFLIQIDEIYSRVVGERWNKSRTRIIGDMLGIYGALTGYSTTVHVYSGLGVFIEWAQKNLSRKEAEKIGKIAMREIAGIEEAVKTFL